ncbi:four helix bundle protein [Psychrobacter sp. UBA6291]|uniref:four helix bundle protein n=1 Tax=Psychrobacter sp. UBA6291 TaxID=1947357 RepID=UPI00257AF580|nr:four helix bundle protein [Psychrobacter sp. UBA6291]
MAVDSESNLDKKFIQTMKLLNIYLNHFPSHEKHGLALKIRQTAYEMYDYIVEAQKRYHKKTTLTNLDIKHEQLRMQVRLAFELSYFGHPKTEKVSVQKLNAKRYLVISASIDEIGKIIGGWIKSLKQ